MHTEVADVVVVGGGMAGLATAHRLSRRRSGARTLLLEAGDRPGGKVCTATVAAQTVEFGPDGVVGEAPVREFLSELELDSQVITANQSGGALVWTGKRLRPLPVSIVGGAPLRHRAILESRLLSPWGLLRAAADYVLPAGGVDSDVALGALLRRRFGDELCERMVAPLLGGIYAGNIDHLSAQAVAPAVLEAARKHRSLARGLQRPAPAAKAPKAGFLSTTGGLGAVVSACAESLGEALRCGVEVQLVYRDGQKWHVITKKKRYECSWLVLAVPAPAAARLLRGAHSQAAEMLTRIPMASVAVVTLAIPAAQCTGLVRGSGFLVAPGAKELIAAATWVSHKWPRGDSSETVLLRASAGRFDDLRWMPLGDYALLDSVLDDLQRIWGRRLSPLAAEVKRWPDALPQYLVGHQQLLQRVRASLPPSLFLTGAAYDGLGLAACIKNGRQTADRLLQALESTPDQIRSADGQARLQR